MLQFIQSNKMEVLASTLCELLKASQQAVLQPQPILVQSPGMSQWLKIEIANQRGIAANLTFPLPSSFIWTLYQQLLPDVPRQTDLSKDAMQWKLLQILEGDGLKQQFPALAEYLEGADDFKCFALAQNIADVFDHYLMYRPDWLAQWEAGQTVAEIEDQHNQAWQMPLWNCLIAKTRELGQSTLHRGALHYQLIDKILHAENLEGLPTQLMIFGISALSPQQLEVLDALAKRIDVYFFWFNPCQEYWTDIVDSKTHARLVLTDKADNAELFDVGNPLLASMGKQGRDFLSLVQQVEHQSVDLFIDARPDTMLSHLQSDVLHLAQRGIPGGLNPEQLFADDQDCPKINIAPTDKSIQVHACHSPLRELEVLQDHLLSLFEAGQAQPGDIIVMMPDVAKYAPYIDAVFGGADAHLRIPYAISDRNPAEESPLVQSFAELTALHHSRFALSDVMDILAVPAMLRRFGLSHQEHQRIRDWCEAAGVRWSLDGQDKQRFEVPPEHQNSWLFGLRRLLAGYMLNDKALLQTQAGKVLPYTDIEGQQALALGKFVTFLDSLSSLLIVQATPRSLTQHIEVAQAMLEQFYLGDEDDEPYLLSIHEALAELHNRRADIQMPVSQSVFSQALKQALQQKGVGQRFLAGAVNFCTLMPMRSIPFDVVCMLGMNDQAYPRQTRPIGFDLIQSAPPKKGDRSRKLDDKYLFLEALLSARQQLYISFMGKSIRDNSTMNPSSLVSELMEYCQQTFVCPTDNGKDITEIILRHHQLQPFDDAYFNGRLPRSFQQRFLVLLQTQVDSHWQFIDNHNLNVTEHHSLLIKDLIQFWQLPARVFLKHRWLLSFAKFEDDTPDNEPFSVSGLQDYTLRHAIISDLLEEQKDHDVLLERYRQSGLLPPGSLARVNFTQRFNEMALFAQEVTRYTGAPRQLLNQSLNLDGLQLHGAVNNLHQDTLVHWHTGQRKPRHLLALWIEWLFVCACERQANCAVMLNAKGKDRITRFAPVEPSLALQQLSQLSQAYCRGTNQPLPFYPEASLLAAQGKNPEQVYAAFMSEGYDGVNAGEGLLPEVQRIKADFFQQWDEMQQLAQQVYGELLAHKEDQ